MIDDRELLSFRQSYYEVLGTLFRREPSGELLQQLADGIGERTHAARNLHPLLGAGWEEIERFLKEAPVESLAETVADEYMRLFIGPLSPEVNPYESFYLTGRLLDRPLADVRTFLKSAGIEKLEEYPEPEDFLAFEMEVMRWLIEKQARATDPQEQTRFFRLQADFLKEHLLVWAPACGRDIERAGCANFYRFAAKILQGFLALELSFLRECGLDTATTLDAARLRYGTLRTWKGPTFDASGEKPGDPSSENQ
ncbi:MAG: TorD/DmsD family molecular chaperone [Candidatus Binatia bacterium]